MKKIHTIENKQQRSERLYINPEVYERSSDIFANAEKVDKKNINFLKKTLLLYTKSNKNK